MVVVATFDFDAVMNLPHKDFEVIAIMQGQERKCRVSKKDRDNLR